MEWIELKRRQPKHRQRVIVYNEHRKEVLEDEYLGYDDFTGEKLQYWNNCAWGVTHWMALPEPPQPERLNPETPKGDAIV